MAPPRPRSRRTSSIRVFAYLAGVLLAAATLLDAFLLPVPHDPTLVLVELGAGVALVVALVLRRRRPSLRRPGYRVLVAALTLGFGISLVLGGAAFDRDARRTLFAPPADDPPAPHDCGLFDLGAGRWNRRARALVAKAFPDYEVKLVRGCRSYDVGFRDVRFRVGRFQAPGIATRLVIEETVEFDGPPGPRTVEVSPYADEDDARSALPVLDAKAATFGALGDGPRLCLLDGHFGGLTMPWWLDCARLPLPEAAPRIPTGWPAPGFVRRCHASHSEGCVVNRQVLGIEALGRNDPTDRATHRYGPGRLGGPLEFGRRP